MKALKKTAQILFSVAFWVGIWWLASLKMGKPLLLPTPADVIKTLLRLLGTADFYRVTAISLCNVIIGILIAVLLGVLLSMLTSHISFLRALLLPLMAVIKATPVASFIILAWILMGASRVPSFITVLIVLPVIWTNLDTGFQKIDPQLREVTKVYRFSIWKRLKFLVIPSLKPYFVSAARTSLGLAWKAGIAAEIITMPKNTIGTMIGESKLYIQTSEMFAWTLVVILLSLTIEFLFAAALKRFAQSPEERTESI